MQKQNKSFTDTVKDIVRLIPQGTVLTYKEVAEKAQHPKAYRAVASIMAKNYDITIPCHRVIKSDGTVGEYNRGGSQQKRKILIEEGVQLEKYAK